MCGKGRSKGKRRACGPASPIRIQISDNPSKTTTPTKEKFRLHSTLSTCLRRSTRSRRCAMMNFARRRRTNSRANPLDWTTQAIGQERERERDYSGNRTATTTHREDIGNFVAPSTNEPHFTANRANPVKCPSSAKPKPAECSITEASSLRQLLAQDRAIPALTLGR